MKEFNKIILGINDISIFKNIYYKVEMSLNNPL